MSAIGKGVGKVASAIGLDDVYKSVRPDKKLKKAEIVMPDEEQLRKDARKRHALRARRSGRVSTILDDETLA